MSGSGSSLFGIFSDANMTDEALKQFSHYDAYNIKL